MSKEFFPSGVQGKFYDENKKIVGYSSYSISSLVWLIIETVIIVSSVSFAVMRSWLYLDQQQHETAAAEAYDFYRSPLWASVDAIPSAYMMSAWLLVIPFLYSIVALRNKTHTKKAIPLFVLSTSICGLLIFVLTVVINFFSLF